MSQRVPGSQGESVHVAMVQCVSAIFGVEVSITWPVCLRHRAYKATTSDSMGPRRFTSSKTEEEDLEVFVPC